MYFLDLGMVGEVTPQMREQMMLLLMAFWQEDVGFLTDVTLMLLGAIDRARPGRRRVPARTSASWWRSTARHRCRDIQLGPMLQEMTMIAVRHGVPLPASLTLTAKAIAQMQLATAELDPELDPFEVAGSFAMRSVLGGMGGPSRPEGAVLPGPEDEGPARGVCGVDRATHRCAAGPEARGQLPRGLARGDRAACGPSARTRCGRGRGAARDGDRDDVRACARMGRVDARHRSACSSRSG